MKAFLEYRCDFCSFHGSKDEVFRHEAGHYGLTADEYAEWDRLEEAVKRASHMVSGVSNERTRHMFDDAVAAVLAFETEHGLKGRNCALVEQP